MNSRKQGITPKIRSLAFVAAASIPAMSACKSHDALEDTKDKLHRTVVSIVEDKIHINGEPTYQGRTWQGNKIEGLLFNSRMVNGIFDDSNPATRDNFAYPDTGRWDPERNTNEFVMAMPSWKAHGMLGFSLNLQGGSPMGYGNKGWVNSTFDSKGNLREDYLNRLEKVLNAADELGMVVILGYFYFGQDEVLEDEAAVINAVDNVTQWIIERRYRNVLIEINNETNHSHYGHAILQEDRVHELIERVQQTDTGGDPLLVSTSYGGGYLPRRNVVSVADFILLHGNDVHHPADIEKLIMDTRAVEGYTTKPIIFNEDDHYDFDKDTNNMVTATHNYASWGYFDFRKWDEPFEAGFQSIPADWKISSERKRAFFEKVKEITGY